MFWFGSSSFLDPERQLSYFTIRVSSKVAEAGVDGKSRESNWFSARFSQGNSTIVFLARLSLHQQRPAKTLDSSLLAQIFAETLSDSLFELTAF
jgi:hypothetical protein